MSALQIAGERPAARSAGSLPPFAGWPVLLVASVAGVLLLVTSGIGELWWDEMYFVAAGRHPAWGYADQPPLIPLLAAGLDALGGGSMVLLRLPATLVAVGTVIVTALVARELGGGRLAQGLAALTSATTHWLTTYGVDPFWWLLVMWLLVRWVRLNTGSGVPDDRLLLAAALVTGLALQTKFLIAVLWVAVGVSVLVCGPRRMLTRPQLWFGAPICAVTVIPGVLWQARNDWPFLRFTESIAAESGSGTAGGWLSVLANPLFHGGLAGTVLIFYALWRLVRPGPLRPYRFVGLTFLGVVAIVLVTGGRSYYATGLYGVLIAVAAVELERHRRRWLAWVAWPGYVLSAWGAVAMLLGVTLYTGVLTGPQKFEPVARAYHALPAQQRPHTVLMTNLYLGASAMHSYADELDLPRAYSPHRGYWYLGAPPDTADQIIYVTTERDLRMFEPYFARYRLLGVDDGMSMWLLTDRTRPWSQIWPAVKSEKPIG